MSTIASQGDISSLFVSPVQNFRDAQNSCTISFLNFIEVVPTLFFSGSYTPVSISNTFADVVFNDPGAAQITGTGLQTSRMTIDRIHFEDPNNNSFDFIGRLDISATGIGAITVQHFEMTVGFYETFSMDGNLRITSDGLTGSANHVKISFRDFSNEVTADYFGNISASTNTGTLNKIILSDTTGSVTIQGNYQAAVWFSALETAPVIADIFTTQSLFSTGDTINVGDSNFAWHGYGGNDKLIGNSGDNEMFGDDGNDTLTGNGGADTLAGGLGEDSIDGGTGDDMMTGGTGNDKYFVDSSGDIIVEQSGEGTDTITSSASFDMLANAQNAEILILTGTGHNDATGNGDNNTITGNAGNNRIDGGAGADKMSGGAGNDTYVVDNAGDSVTETSGIDTVEASITYTLGTGIESLLLAGGGNIHGTGNTGINTITGNDGDNTLNGGTGADTLIGALGNDVYVVDNIGDVVSEDAAGGLDTVMASANYVLGAEIENLVLTGTRAAKGTGNADDNTITGNAGINTLDGGSGFDTLSGGLGNDVYLVHDGDVTVFELSGAGSDTVRSDIDYALDDFVENLVLLGAARIGTGNAAANTITGTFGNDTLDGGGSIDKLIGGLGDDTYYVENTGDTVSEGVNGGNDTVYSTAGSYTLAANIETLILTGNAGNGIGNAGNNVITGANVGNSLSGMTGNDTLDGGAAADTLTGGTGADSFVFTILDGTSDLVTDFSRTQGDKIDIDDIVSGYDPFSSDLNEFVRFDNTGTNALLWVDSDGALNGENFVLVATFNRVDLLQGDLSIIL